MGGWFSARKPQNDVMEKRAAMADQLSTHVAVVGGGPGGYAAAFMAADLGLEVTLIDVEANPGGTCLYRGCIPSKALLHVAKVLNDARDAEAFGIHFDEPRIDLDQVRASTQAVVDQLTGGLGQLSRARKIAFVQGRAALSDAHTLEIFRNDGSEAKLHCEYIILAPGSRPALFSPLIDSPRMMNSSDALLLPDIPKSLLIIGGGYIGLELGTVYASLGSEVTVVEMTEGLLPGVDKDLVGPLAKRLEEPFEEIHVNTKVKEMKSQKNGIKVVLDGPSVDKSLRVFDRVMVSVGRKPNSSGLGLQTTRVELDEHGFIKVDEQRRTAEPNIFAIGDVVGGMMLAHKASHEGRVAAEVIAGANVAFEPRAIPAVVFTDPEIAWCGLTETEAKKTERKVRVARFPWTASGRAATLQRMEGHTKILCDPDTNAVLGMGIVGPGAGELIAEGVLAIEMGALASDLELTIHPHPTMSETIMESAAGLYGHSTHIYRAKSRS
jgi:dihydrolipoamide dehydrogenase